MIAYRIIDGGGSRSFPGDDAIRGAQAVDTADVVIVIGQAVHAALATLDIPAYRAVIVELGNECLGDHAPEDFGCEGGNVVGFSRFCLGQSPPSRLVELVVQPRTDAEALQAATSIFEEFGYSTVRCRDVPGRIVDRLVRPYFNRALAAVDSGLSEAAELDAALRMGLGYRRGPIELLRDSGLEHHFDVSSYLYAALGEAPYLPARRAQVAAARRAHRRNDAP